MKLVSLFFFFLAAVLLSANPNSADSLLLQLQKNEADKVIQILSTQPNTKQKAKSTLSEKLKEDYLLMLAYQIKSDTVNSMALRSTLLSKELSNQEAQLLILFVFKSGYKFVTKSQVFFFIQDFGIALTKQHHEPRAHFSFLQQKFSMYQMTNQVNRIPEILKEMNLLSEGSGYLAYQTDMHHCLYYCGIQNDSCTAYFEQYFSNTKSWLGKPNPFFLNMEGYSLKKDSSTLAGVVTEYSKFYSRKGDLKKAGELLIQSLQLIPDTPTLTLLTINTQLALANIYTELVNPSRAILYVEKAIALCEENHLERLRKTSVASSYAYALMASGDYKAAAVELQGAMHAFPRKFNCLDPKMMASRAALNAAFMHDYITCKALIDTVQSMPCKDNADIIFYQAMAKGAYAMHQGQFQLALESLNTASGIAKSIKSIGWIKDVLYLEYLCYKQFNKTKESITSLETYVHLKDSLYRSGQDVALFDIEAAYQKTLQDETIARLDAENEVNTSRLTAQKKNFALASIALAIVCVFLFVVLRLYKKVSIANALLSKAIDEKNILLREIHHRVKNNLQVISSLLKLQSGYMKDDAAIQAIAEGRSRVQSMALLHQNLYREDNLTGVNMQEYFDNLIQGLFDTYNISADRIQLHKNIASLDLDVDTVVPLGLITNELISNALKHAFPGNTPGNLYVELFEQSGNLILKVRDDGNGFTSSSTQEGFGNKLIQSLSQKLEADITTRSTSGTEITLTIRAYRKAA